MPHILGTEAAPSTPTAGNLKVYADSTNKSLGTVDESGNRLRAPAIRQNETIAVQPQKATTLSTPQNPTGTTSTAGVMMGLNVAITPQVTGNIHVTVCGSIANNTTGDGETVRIRMGTGTAPTNGAALTGTAYGSLQADTAVTSSLKHPFSVTALVTGLTVGTAYWIDIEVAAVTGGTATATSVAVSAFEL